MLSLRQMLRRPAPASPPTHLHRSAVKCEAVEADPPLPAVNTIPPAECTSIRTCTARSSTAWSTRLSWRLASERYKDSAGLTVTGSPSLLMRSLAAAADEFVHQGSEVGQAGIGQGGGLLLTAGPDVQHGRAANRAAGPHIGVVVPDQPGLLGLGPGRGDGAADQARQGLAAPAVVLGHVRADEEVDYVAARCAYLLGHLYVDLLDECRVDQPAPDARLVGGNRDPYAHRAQPGDRLHRAGHEPHVLGAQDVGLVVLEDDAFAVQHHQFRDPPGMPGHRTAGSLVPVELGDRGARVLVVHPAAQQRRGNRDDVRGR